MLILILCEWFLILFGYILRAQQILNMLNEVNFEHVLQVRNIVPKELPHNIYVHNFTVNSPFGILIF